VNERGCNRCQGFAAVRPWLKQIDATCSREELVKQIGAIHPAWPGTFFFGSTTD